MKKVILIALLFTSVTAAFAQTVDEVVNKFIEASGGKDKLNSINTLHYKQAVKFTSMMGDIEIPIEYAKQKNKLFRMQVSMQMGPQSMESYTLITDTAGFNLVPGNPFSGTETTLKKMDEKELKAQSYQLDASGMFPVLVDYATKGHKVELLKDEKVNKEDCYKLKVTLSSGQEMNYYINKTTNLVVKADAKGAMAASMSGMGSILSGFGGNRGLEKMELSTEYKDYKDVDGIMFPTKVTVKTQMGESKGEITDIEVNKELAAKFYKAQ